MFVDRDPELEFLRNHLSKANPEMLVLYGRRRVGKTKLVNQYLETQDDFSDQIYYLADERGTEKNVDRFAEEAAKTFDDVKPDAEDFDDVFEYISSRTDSCLVVIDEFSYLVENDDSVPSTFQYVWDEIIEDSISLIILGSSISMIEEGVLSYESPLYGRRTGQWKITPLRFRHAVEFFPDYDFEDRIRAYATLGGVPAYLEKFDPDVSLFDNIERKVLSKGSFLYEEPEFLLRQELREPSTYMSILESMALGATTVTKIANDINRDASSLSRYLKNLRELEMVKKVTPVTADPGSRGIYVVSDNFFKFWFRFVYPNLNSLERGATTDTRKAVESEMDRYVSRIFEEVCRDVVYEEGFEFEATNVGRWWYKENEIDVVAINEETNEILLGECKWTTDPVGINVLENLRTTSESVRWKNGSRREKYVLFSRSGFTENVKKVRRGSDDVLLYGTDEIEEISL
ncbi:MAG: ATP-binding protein [Halobacteria archaeon]|nr:ATP-binding protein [Halobacteria archaeon]